MDGISSGSEVGGAGGASSYSALKRLDEQWLKMRNKISGSGPPPEVVSRDLGPCLNKISKTELFDIIICGGTLGIFIAATLACRGLRVAIIERGRLQGRAQEWNISRKELNELVDMGILSLDSIEDVISAEFNPNRCGFKGFDDIWVEDILNLGVSPLKLIDHVKEVFLKMGGLILEGSGLSKVNIYDDAAAQIINSDLVKQSGTTLSEIIVTLENGQQLYSRLVIDAMGNFSPIIQQIRGGEHPDGICLVVGTCARGFNKNLTSDVIYSNLPVIPVGQSVLQCFWEAFPAGSGSRDRTCYLFSYMDVKPDSPSLEQLFEIFWDRMPEYQNVNLDELEILRVLFGIFPTYRASPLPAAFDRVLQVGDASGIQSPVSFGGFGSMTRHLGRLTHGISESLDEDLLDKESLALLNPYMPNLSASWLFQKAMSAQNSLIENPDFINTLLATNFQSMQGYGDTVLRPFLQDVIQFGPLTKTLGSVILRRPDILPSIFKQVGFKSILEWALHFVMLGVYTFLFIGVSPLLLPWISNLPRKERYIWRRRLDSWKYGSGLDYNI